ncbi:MAG: hypothetical protein PHY72_01190 [Candidatus Pacebacteria bacterium]|nr:hypothetical protein [Candidatus Paceibacterota bacterium]
MTFDFSGIFFKNVSSIASLFLIGALAFILGTYVIIEAGRIEKLQKPLPLYVGHFSTTTFLGDY